jgi:ubiquitin carboxyl-terminal hydrolase 34
MRLDRHNDSDSPCDFTDEHKFVDRLFAILQLSLSRSSDWQLSSRLYTTLLEASFHSRGVWEAFSERDDIQPLHERMFLLDDRRELRFQIAKYIELVFTAIEPSQFLSREELASFLWRMVAVIIPKTIQHASQASPFYDIANLVLRQADQINTDESALRSYLMQWSSLLLSHRHDEFVGRHEVDEIVLGLTRILKTCIAFLKAFKKPLNTGTLMDRIYTKFLVPSADNAGESDGALPVLEERTRKELYELVTALCENIPCLERMVKLIEPRIAQDRFNRIHLWDRSRDIRAESGYVGLSNLANTCYMNSLISQLFMNVEFREFILSRNVADPNGSQKLLAELQRLFATMQDSYVKYASTERFARAIRTPDNAGIDVTIQMDVDEFFNLLFDQCEEQVLSSEAKQLFRSFYGGQTVNQIKSKECEHVSEREETYFSIQCDVQGKSNLQESLQAFIEGDVMEGGK